MKLFSVNRLRRYILVTAGLALMYLPALSQEDFYNIENIQEIRITFKENNWRHLLDSLFANYGENARLVGSVSVNGKLFDHAGVRYKGFSSYDDDQAKNPFNIELDYGIKDQNYQSFTKLKLSNVIHDPSFIREVLSYEIARKYMPASRANFANVYINDTLIGLYTNVEAVDKIFIGKQFTSNDNCFFKGSPNQLQYPFGQNSNLAYTHGTDTSGYMPYYKMESETGWGKLLNMIDVLNNDTLHIPLVLNTDAVLWMHAFNYVVVNLDSYIAYSQNYYMYQDDNDRFNPVLWDMNMSFGSFRFSDATALNLTIAKTKQLNPLQHLYSVAYSPRPLMKNLFQNSTFRKIYLAHMRTIIDENFTNGEYFSRGQEIQAIIDLNVLNDTNKFYSYSDFVNNLSVTTGAISDQYPGIKDLMEARIAYLDTFPGFRGEPLLSEIAHAPEYPSSGELTTVTCKSSGANHVELAYRFKSHDVFLKTDMFDDGAHNDGNAGDSIFGASTITEGNIIQYYIFAENDSAAAFAPPRAEFEFYTIQPVVQQGDLVINEFMADNKVTAKDQDAEFDDWIELYNNSSEDIRLQGIHLSDDSEDLFKWTFPDTIIKAKNYLIVWADEDIGQDGLHSCFSLSTEGGALYITAQNDQKIDSVLYGKQLTSITTGRYPNGKGDFNLLIPSFSQYNFAATTPAESFLVFPNPAQDKIYIERNASNHKFSVDIYNTGGQKMISMQFNIEQDASSSTVYEFDISMFNNGLYFIRITDDDKTEISRFVCY